MSQAPDTKNLKRDIQPMPEFVANSLRNANLDQAYLSRPAYQRNDYLAWINRAVRDATKQKRLDQMLSELKAGNVYMKMKWNPR